MTSWQRGADKEWERIESAVSRTLAGQTVLGVSGAKEPRRLANTAVAVRTEQLNGRLGSFEAGLACFCLEELKETERPRFLDLWHSCLSDGATAVVADRRGAGCDTAFELHELFAEHGTELDVQLGQNFWWVRYKVVHE